MSKEKYMKQTRNINHGTRFLQVNFSLLGGKLSLPQTMVYSIMANDYLFFLENKGLYSPSNSYIGDQAGLHSDTVRDIIPILEKHGYIEKVSAKKGCTTIWHVNPVSEDGVVIYTGIRYTDKIEQILGIKKTKPKEKEKPRLVIVNKEDDSFAISTGEQDRIDNGYSPF
jgi:hypothetical protein